MPDASRLCFCVCLLAVVSCAAAAEPAAQKATNSSRLGQPITSQQQAAAQPKAVETAAVKPAASKPAAYRGKGDSSYQAYHVGKDSYSRPGYDRYSRAQQPSADLPQPSNDYSYQNPPQYPNANPGYVNRGYQPADADMPAPYYSGAATNQPLRGYQPGYDKYASQPEYDSKYPSQSGYDSKYPSYDKYPSQAAYDGKYPSYDRYPSQPGYDSKYPGYDKYPSQSGYDSKYPAYDKAYQPGYDSKYPAGGYGSASQYPSDSYARTKPQPPLDSYWQSYQPAPKPTPQPAGRGYYGDRAAEYSVYGLDVAKSQQGVSGNQMYRVTADGAYPLPASPSVPLAGARQHLPTVVHMDEVYKQQQQQQQLLASLRAGSSLLGGGALGSSGYGGAYNQGSYGSGVLSKQPALQPGVDPKIQQWWQDHQDHVNSAQGKPSSSDKLDALLSIINKVVP